MSEQETRTRRTVVVDIDVPQFRADTDQRGDWYVWRRMGATGWATLRPALAGGCVAAER